MTTSVDRRSVSVGNADSRNETGLRRFPLALQCSVSGARRAGLSSTTSVDRRGAHAGEADSKDENGARR